jgi:hypothetical protein
MARDATRALAALVGLAVAAPPAVAAAQLSPIRPDPMRPSAWAPSEGEECYSRGRGRDGVVAQDRICDGPRRVPVPRGEAAARAERLGLGTRPAADRLRIGRPPPEWLAEIPSEPRDDLLWPVARGLFSRGFGHVRRAEIRHRPHNGVDIVAAMGAHVRAANDGLVVYADNGVRGYGNFLILLHADGTATFYGHCRAVYVAPGQLVARGQVVAEVGNTGRPHVPHLHFEWRRRGHPMDPIHHLVERPDPDVIRPDAQTDFAPPPPNARPAPRPEAPEAPEAPETAETAETAEPAEPAETAEPPENTPPAEPAAADGAGPRPPRRFPAVARPRWPGGGLRNRLRERGAPQEEEANEGPLGRGAGEALGARGDVAEGPAPRRAPRRARRAHRGRA